MSKQELTAVIQAGKLLSSTLPHREEPSCFREICLTKSGIKGCESAYVPCCNYAANLMFLDALSALESEAADE